MKRRIMFHLAVVVLWWMTAYVPPVEAFSSGSTGADGAFTPTANTVLAVPASGVFHFTTVNIPSGVLVTFQSNAANTPITILASGDVTVNGVISLDGGAGGTNGGQGGPGGPGGFRGGAGTSATIAGAGLGPGGGVGSSGLYTGAAPAHGGSFGGLGGGPSPAPVYGNSLLLPLIGGSGGGGGGLTGGGAGGGGGVLLLASSGTITLNGSLTARGGNGGGSSVTNARAGAGGSGGGIRLVSAKIQGGGSIAAGGGSGGTTSYYIQSSSGPASGTEVGSAGGSGRIRLEAEICCGSLTWSGSMGLPLPLVLSSLPTLKITTVGGQTAPDPPGGNFGAVDIQLPAQSGPTAIGLGASGVPLGTTAIVKVTPESGAAPTTVTSSPLSGTVASSTATASATLPTGSSFITATVTIAAGSTTASLPAFAGDPVAAVRLETQFGGATTTTYVLASGREVSLQ